MPQTKSTGKTGSGLAWASGLALTAVVVQVAHTILAARLLAPADFGAYALSLTVVQLINFAVTAGLGVSIARMPPDEGRPEPTATLVGLVGGSGLGVILLAAAPAISGWFDGGTVMTELLRIFSPYPLLTSMVIVGVSSMRRAASYRRAAAIESGSVVVGLAISATCLLHGVGIISLAVGLLSGQAIGVLAVSTSLAVPRFSAAAFRRLGYFASHVGLQNLAHFCIYTSPVWFLGAISTNYDVGQFARAWSLVTLPLGQVMLAATKVLQAAFPHKASDESSAAAAVQSARAANLALSTIAPVFCLGAVGAPFVVPLVLGDDWTTAAHIAAFLVGFGFLNVLYTFSASANESYAVMRRVWAGIALFIAAFAASGAMLVHFVQPVAAMTAAMIIGQIAALVPYGHSILVLSTARAAITYRSVCIGLVATVVVAGAFYAAADAGPPAIQLAAATAVAILAVAIQARHLRSGQL